MWSSVQYVPKDYPCPTVLKTHEGEKPAIKVFSPICRCETKAKQKSDTSSLAGEARIESTTSGTHL